MRPKSTYIRNVDRLTALAVCLQRPELEVRVCHVVPDGFGGHVNYRYYHAPCFVAREPIMINVNSITVGDTFLPNNITCAKCAKEF